MATYVFSTITSAEAAEFTTDDVLLIDTGTASSAVVVQGEDETTLTLAGKTVTIPIASGPELTSGPAGILRFTDGSTLLVGNRLPDDLDGAAAGSQLIGNDGNDTIDAANTSGTDLIYGNLGNDSLTGNGGNDTVYGGQGADVLNGNIGADLLYGNLGDDTIDAGFGNDTVYGGQGADTIDAGAGVDVIYGNIGADTILGGEGNDTLFGGQDADALDGGASDDLLYGNLADDVINDAAGDNTVFGGQGGDTITVGDGENLVHGNRGDDNITAGAEDDTIHGDAGADTINAGTGNDLIYGNLEADSIVGSNEHIAGDTVYGGQGADTVTYATGSHLIYGNLGNDSITMTSDVLANASGDTVYGGQGDDVITTALSNDDSLLGGAGNDVFYISQANAAAAGDDNAIDGGAGEDTLTFMGNLLDLTGANLTDIETFRYNDAATVRLTGAQAEGRVIDASHLASDVAANLALNGGGTIDLSTSTLNNINQISVTGSGVVLTGSSSDDHIIGTASSDIIAGGDGDDTIEAELGVVLPDESRTDILSGGAGADSILGGASSDTIFGGTGADTITGDSGADLISGGDGRDVINITTESHADTINGGEGVDTYLFRGSYLGNNSVGKGADNVTAELISGVMDVLSFGNGTGDILDFSGVLQEFAALGGRDLAGFTLASARTANSNASLDFSAFMSQASFDGLNENSAVYFLDTVNDVLYVAFGSAVSSVVQIKLNGVDGVEEAAGGKGLKIDELG